MFLYVFEFLQVLPISFQLRSTVRFRADPAVERFNGVNHQRLNLRLGSQVSAVRLLLDPDPSRPVRVACHQKLGSRPVPNIRTPRHGLSSARSCIPVPGFPGIQVAKTFFS